MSGTKKREKKLEEVRRKNSRDSYTINLHVCCCRHNGTAVVAALSFCMPVLYATVMRRKRMVKFSHRATYPSSQLHRAQSIQRTRLQIQPDGGEVAHDLAARQCASRDAARMQMRARPLESRMHLHIVNNKRWCRRVVSCRASRQLGHSLPQCSPLFRFLSSVVGAGVYMYPTPDWREGDR
ncbi:hypothetical protein B0T19DRAFT_245665 [Cercophora scortea]|uniref:Transmembrane protein n=1 Tax=Cercophora scortea TaxID=314031 RepID=A0AAE0I900_9PEZI|nr:hypothetical protein B0T19DRAFT_245665 [Cercophora scortea]